MFLNLLIEFFKLVFPTFSYTVSLSLCELEKYCWETNALLHNKFRHRLSFVAVLDIDITQTNTRLFRLIKLVVRCLFIDN